MTDPISLSIVMPVHNEQDNVAPLHAELRAVLDRIGEPHEIIFVDDGSTDGTRARIGALARNDATVRLLELDGNFGEAAALSAGFHRARGEIVITLDGDGQNDPADIPRLLATLRERDLSCVSGRRAERQEAYWTRVLPSRAANRLIAALTGVPIHDTGCGLKVYRRTRLRWVHLPRGMNRFLPAILGARLGEVAELEVRDRARGHGASHYALGRTFVVLRDLLALRFLIADPRRWEIRFALATAGAAAMASVVMNASVGATAALDAVAILCGVNWWNIRRFNRAQSDGVYRLRAEAAAGGVEGTAGALEVR